MSLLKSNSVQIGQSVTAANNFTLSVPSSPDGTIKLARGNSGATTADILSIDASGVITGSTFSGATINSSTVNGGSITSGTAVASTSGTAIDFTGIPSWAKRVTVMLNGVSSTGANVMLIQLGSGSFTVTGYNCLFQGFGATTAVASYTAGFGLGDGGDSSGMSRFGNIIFTNINSNNWVCTGGLARISTNSSGLVNGSISLSGLLDRIRITTNSADTFDAGTINIMYEG